MTIDDSLAMPPEEEAIVQHSQNGATPVTDAPAGWQVFNLTDAYTEREPTRYIVDGILAEASLNIMYAPPAAMKSMLLADLACAVAGGHIWLPGAGGGVKVERRPVLWLDMDNGARRTHERFGALGKGHNLPPDAPLHYVSMPTDPLLHLTDLEAVNHLIWTIRDYQAGLVVMDNLGLIAGDVEENSAKMAEVMSYLRAVAERTGAAVVVIHHQRKGGNMAGGRIGDTLRGHSSIEAALDLALHVVREPGENMLTITSTKTRGVDVPTLRARFNYEHRPGTKDLGIAWFDDWTIESKFATLDPETIVVYDAARDVLQRLPDVTQGVLQMKIKDITDLANTRILKHLEQLVAAGRLVTFRGAKNALIYGLPRQ